MQRFSDPFYVVVNITECAKGLVGVKALKSHNAFCSFVSLVIGLQASTTHGNKAVGSRSINTAVFQIRCIICSRGMFAIDALSCNRFPRLQNFIFRCVDKANAVFLCVTSLIIAII